MDKKISGHILVDKNDTKFLQDGINNIEDITNEIVIGFEDKNEMNNFNTPYKKFHIPFKGSYSNLRNELNRKCQYDYILILDVDELWFKPLLIKDLIKHNPKTDIFQFIRWNFTGGKFKNKFHPDWCWRLLKNDRKIKFKRKVHPILNFPPDYQVKKVNEIPLIHVKSEERQIKQNQKYDKWKKY